MITMHLIWFSRKKNKINNNNNNNKMIYKHLHFTNYLLVDKHAVSVQIAFCFQLAPAGSYPVHP